MDLKLTAIGFLSMIKLYLSHLISKNLYKVKISDKGSEILEQDLIKLSSNTILYEI